MTHNGNIWCAIFKKCAIFKTIVFKNTFIFRQIATPFISLHWKQRTTFFKWGNLYRGVKIVTKKGKYDTLWLNSFQVNPITNDPSTGMSVKEGSLQGCQFNTFLDILVFFSKDAA